MFLLDSLRFDEAYGILDSSFPCDELKAYPRLLSDFIFGGMKILALGDEEELSAVLTLWEFDDFIFVENFAVAKSKRNAGLGTDLIKNVISHYPTKNILLEVESPETDYQKRRIRFYEDKGFKNSNIEYIQPMLRDKPSEIRLTLMYHGADLSEKELISFRNRVFSRVYGLKNLE